MACRSISVENLLPTLLPIDIMPFRSLLHKTVMDCLPSPHLRKSPSKLNIVEPEDGNYPRLNYATELMFS